MGSKNTACVKEMTNIKYTIKEYSQNLVCRFWRERSRRTRHEKPFALPFQMKAIFWRRADLGGSRLGGEEMRSRCLVLCPHCVLPLPFDAASGHRPIWKIHQRFIGHWVDTHLLLDTWLNVGIGKVVEAIFYLWVFFRRPNIYFKKYDNPPLDALVYTCRGFMDADWFTNFWEKQLTLWPYLILVTTATTGGGGKFFQVRGIFLTVNAKSSHKR